MHQSWMFSSHRYHSLSEVCGRILSSPARVRCAWWVTPQRVSTTRYVHRATNQGGGERTSMAFSASDFWLTHHCGFMTDSIKSPLLAQTGMLIGFSASPT